MIGAEAARAQTFGPWPRARHKFSIGTEYTHTHSLAHTHAHLHTHTHTLNSKFHKGIFTLILCNAL